MKTENNVTLDPDAAFPDPKSTPADADLKSALGPAFPVIAQIVTSLRTTCPAATSAWQYSPKAGWYRVALLKKRRLFYLVPKRDAFRLSLILGGKAIASLQHGPHAGEVDRLLKTAKRYPEGTSISFEAARCEPELIAALLAAKIAF